MPMGKSKRPRKAYRPRTVIDPLTAIRPAAPSKRLVVLATFNAALDMMVRHDTAGEQEWRDLSDAINTVEALVSMGKLVHDEVMPIIDRCITAMAEAGKRYREGKGMRLSGPGIEALRDVIAIYEQCSEGLTELEMLRAADLVAERVRRALVGKPMLGTEVVSV